MTLLERATTHAHDLVTKAIRLPVERRVFVLFDAQSVLSRLLTEAYKQAVPQATLLDFDSKTPEEVRVDIATLVPGDLIVLIQSGSFRLSEFRFRLELFQKGLAVIEHPHLGRIPEVEHETFIDCLAFEQEYFQAASGMLCKRIASAQTIIVKSKVGSLTYTGPFEEPKKNIGDYTGMKNTGGQFPIGEVFTEPTNLSAVNGSIAIYAFGDRNFRVEYLEQPLTLHVKDGTVVGCDNAPESFVSILDEIRANESVILRELGFGLNRALTKTRRLIDVGSYERMCGVHLSLGEKHTVYSKQGFAKHKTHYHVDIFVDVETVEIDGVVVYRDGGWVTV